MNKTRSSTPPIEPSGSAPPQVGVVGLGVMGAALGENLMGNGFSIAVSDADGARVDQYTRRHRQASAAEDLRDLVGKLARPRCVIVIIPAGKAVDKVIATLQDHLAPGDIIADFGNSHWRDTQSRFESSASSGLHFIGCGISGGEEGARRGPALMAGGDERAWPIIGSMLETLAASVDGEPCCAWIGPGGSGHYVKMVHNGIEYGDMQLIAEVYDLLRHRHGRSHAEIAALFTQWNRHELESYLVEITADILRKCDHDGEPLLERVRDSAGQKGTGRWTGIAALDLGAAAPLITEAVFSRSLSAMERQRQLMAKAFESDMVPDLGAPNEAAVQDIEDALYCAKLISYSQGFSLLKMASDAYAWRINCADVARNWRGGCIIRSALLNPIREAYERDAALSDLMIDGFFVDQLKAKSPAWRRVVSDAVAALIPVPALSSGLNYFHALRRNRLPANLIQAQRDYFGAHTYERVDRPKGEAFHSAWGEPDPDPD